MLRTRRYFPEKLFDTEPVWLGPKYLKGFAAEPDCHSRWETIQQARNGGSMTPEIRMRIIFDRWFSRAESGASRKKPFWGENGVGSHCTGDRQIQHCTLASNNYSAVISYQSLVIISYQIRPSESCIQLSVLELCVLERTLRFNHSNATGIDIMDGNTGMMLTVDG